MNNLIPDNPEYDATDFAHPAFWRGQDYAVNSLCLAINNILDGKGIHGIAQEPWEATRKRIQSLISISEGATDE